MTYIDNGVYFEKPSGWGSTINAYIYGGASETQITGAWPGKAMKEVGDGVKQRLLYNSRLPENC